MDKVLGGHGIVGSTIIPPAMAGGFWHLEPPNLRMFDLDVARQKLDAAEYKLDASGKRLDHEGKPINLKMVVPSSSTTYSQSAEFLAAWWKELGIGVTVQSLDEDAVSALEKPPEYDPPGKADFDVVVWNWAGDVDPNSLLKNATTDAITNGNSDSFFSNPRYDELFALQGKENDQAKRKAYIDEMQQILYDKAPYHVLFYDAALSAWRTDRFGGWRLSPEEGGLPFFAYGTAGYDYLTAPGPEPTPTAAASAAAVGSAERGGVAGGSRDAGPERLDGRLDDEQRQQHAPARRCDRARHRGRRRRSWRGRGDAARPARRSDRGDVVTSARDLTGIRRWGRATSLRRFLAGDPDDRRDRRAQLHPVPGDARIAGADVAQPQRSRRPPGRTFGRGGVWTSRCSRTSSSATSRPPLRGDFGQSYKYKGQDVTEVIANRVWPTLILFGLGELIAIVVGLVLGAYSGWKRGGRRRLRRQRHLADPLFDAVLPA